MIEEREEQIKQLKQELENDAEMIKKTVDENEKMETDLAEVNQRQEDLSGQIKAKQEEHMKEAQEPIRITKHNESTSQGVDKLEDELKKLRAVSKKQDFDLSILKKNIEKTQEKEKVLTADLDQN